MLHCSLPSSPQNPRILSTRKQAKSVWTRHFCSSYSFFNVYAFFFLSIQIESQLTLSLTNYSFAVSFKSNTKLMLGLRNNYDKILIATYLNHSLIISSCLLLANNNAVCLKKLLKDVSPARASLNSRNPAVSLEQLIGAEWFSHRPFLWRLDQEAFAKRLSRTGGIRMCFRAFLFFIKSATQASIQTLLHQQVHLDGLLFCRLWREAKDCWLCYIKHRECASI